MIDGWRPYAKLKGMVECSTSAMVLPPFGVTVLMSGPLLSLGAEVGTEKTSGMASSDCGQQQLQITYKMKTAS